MSRKVDSLCNFNFNGLYCINASILYKGFMQILNYHISSFLIEKIIINSFYFSKIHFNSFHKEQGGRLFLHFSRPHFYMTSLASLNWMDTSMKCCQDIWHPLHWELDTLVLKPSAADPLNKFLILNLGQCVKTSQVRVKS